MDEPDGYFIIHNRMTDTLYFGPFKTLEEAHQWHEENNRTHRVQGVILPLYLTVDWNRR
jgi:hypothetical protein